MALRRLRGGKSRVSPVLYRSIRCFDFVDSSLNGEDRQESPPHCMVDFRNLPWYGLLLPADSLAGRDSESPVLCRLAFYKSNEDKDAV